MSEEAAVAVMRLRLSWVRQAVAPGSSTAVDRQATPYVA